MLPPAARPRFSENILNIAAAKRELEAVVCPGTFRSDLYDRLNILPIVVPPLREGSKMMLMASTDPRCRTANPPTVASAVWAPRQIGGDDYEADQMKGLCSPRL
jgi:Sigma-54 interaction domain